MEKNIIQNNKKLIQCDRCGNDFTSIVNLRKHFNRKKKCRPLLKDISIDILKEKYKVRKGVYICENCGKEYKSSNGKYKHKKKCLVNPIIIEKKENDKLKEELQEKEQTIEKKNKALKCLEEQIKELLLEKLELMEENAKVINHNIDDKSTNIGRDQNNKIIIINNFGEENLEYLLKDDNFLKKCIESPINSVPKYLDAVHFNKEHPENSNIKLKNLQSPYMDYMKEGKWNKIEQKLLIPKIINKSVSAVSDMIYNDEYINADTDDDEEKKNKTWDEYENELTLNDDNKLKKKNRIKN